MGRHRGPVFLHADALPQFLELVTLPVEVLELGGEGCAALREQLTQSLHRRTGIGITKDCGASFPERADDR